MELVTAKFQFIYFTNAIASTQIAEYNDIDAENSKLQCHLCMLVFLLLPVVSPLYVSVVIITCSITSVC